jgi:hypothetical protein
LEDHTPAGSRRDEAQIRGVVNEYYRSFAERDWVGSRRFFVANGMVSYGGGGRDSSAMAVVVPVDSIFQWLARLQESGALVPPQNQLIRTDLRQSDGYATVWVTVRQVVPRHGQPSAEGEDQEHLDLQRTSDGWRIILLTLPWLSH